MATKNGASHRSLQNQTVGIKVWVRATEYNTIQQTPGIGALFHSPAKPSGTTHSGQTKKDRPQEGLHLCTRETLDQPPLLGRSARPHAAARRSTSSVEDEAATDHRPADETSAAFPNTEHEPPGGRGADDHWPPPSTITPPWTPDPQPSRSPPPSTTSPCHHPAVASLDKATRCDVPQTPLPRPPPRIPPWIPPCQPSTSPATGWWSPPLIHRLLCSHGLYIP
jgi:hypothetical protein